MEIKKLLITDDHAYIIDGIIAGLKEKFTIGSMTICHSPKDTVEQVEKQKFDLYILDLGFRTETNIDIRQLEYIRQISQIDPQAKIIVFTMREDFAMVSILSKLEHVKGIVLKGPEKEYLQEAVKQVMNGGTYLCPRFKMIYKRSEDFRRKKKFKNGPLTPIEVDILRRLAAGQRSSEIAKQMGYQVSTIVSYRRDLKRKLDVITTMDMVVMGIIFNYINIDELALGILDREPR